MSLVRTTYTGLSESAPRPARAAPILLANQGTFDAAGRGNPASGAAGFSSDGAAADLSLPEYPKLAGWGNIILFFVEKNLLNNRSKIK